MVDWLAACFPTGQHLVNQPRAADDILLCLIIYILDVTIVITVHDAIVRSLPVVCITPSLVCIDDYPLVN